MQGLTTIVRHARDGGQLGRRLLGFLISLRQTVPTRFGRLLLMCRVIRLDGGGSGGGGVWRINSFSALFKFVQILLL